MRGDLTRHVTHGPITSTAIVKRDVFFEAYSSWGHGEGGGAGVRFGTQSRHQVAAPDIIGSAPLTNRPTIADEPMDTHTQIKKQQKTKTQRRARK